MSGREGRWSLRAEWRETRVERRSVDTCKDLD